MIDQRLSSQIKQALATAQNIFIALPQNPNFDKVAASLGLYLSLTKTQKKVEIASPTEMTVEFSPLIGVDKIKNHPQGGKDNLIISFDYVEEAIERVSYNIENGKFNLVIKPKPGFPPLDSSKVQYTYSGGKADLILTIGASSKESLGNLFRDNEEVFEQTQIINIDSNLKNQQYGQINLVDPTSSSVSEQVVNLIAELGSPTDEDIGTNLLLGIERITNHFTSDRVSSSTFEAAAFCLKIGARKQIRRPLEKKIKIKPQLKPMPTKLSAQKPPIEVEETKEEPSPDWLKPKIYKGDTRI